MSDHPQTLAECLESLRLRNEEEIAHLRAEVASLETQLAKERSRLSSAVFPDGSFRELPELRAIEKRYKGGLGRIIAVLEGLSDNDRLNGWQLAARAGVRYETLNSHACDNRLARFKLRSPGSGRVTWVSQHTKNVMLQRTPAQKICLQPQ